MTGIGRIVAASVGTGAEMVEGVEVSAELAKEVVNAAGELVKGFGKEGVKVGEAAGKTTTKAVEVVANASQILATGLGVVGDGVQKLSNYAKAQNKLKQIDHDIQIQALTLGKDEKAANLAQSEKARDKLQLLQQDAKNNIKRMNIERQDAENDIKRMNIKLQKERQDAKFQAAMNIIDESVEVASDIKEANATCEAQLAESVGVHKLGKEARRKWCKQITTCSNYTPSLSRVDRWNSWKQSCNSKMAKFNNMVQTNTLKERATKDTMIEEMLRNVPPNPAGGTRKRNKKTKKRKTRKHHKTRKRAKKHKTKYRAKKRNRKTCKHPKK